MRPKLLDLFCGAGGAAMGYHRAGFDVVGVDMKPQPRYPFEFLHMDALFLVENYNWRANPDRYVAIHASPPCQAYSQGTLSQRARGDFYPDLVAPTRDALNRSKLPWVIENVPGAPVRADFLLCGSQFGLRLVRHRLFELWEPPTDLTLLAPCSHDRYAVTVTGHGTPSYVRESRAKRGIVREDTIVWKRDAMGIDWMNRDELSQAIPPAYTEFIGAQLLRAIGVAA